VGQVGGVPLVEEKVLEAASTILFVISATWASTVLGDSRVEAPICEANFFNPPVLIFHWGTGVESNCMSEICDVTRSGK
jgi:hypothetical protein